MSAVRLWWRKAVRGEPCAIVAERPPCPEYWHEYIALPAAEHAKLVALLWEWRETARPIDFLGSDPRSLVARTDAAIAGLEGGAGKGNTTGGSREV